MTLQSQPEPGISAFLSGRIAAGDFPSAVYLVSERGRVCFAEALGNAVLEPYRISAALDTLYDLASLTKPLVTGLLFVRRIELGEITLDSSVSHYLPEFERADKHSITIRQLLTHSSGLPAWRPLYILAEGERERAIGVIANGDLEYQPGTRVIYSDLGFITLGFLLERITGKLLAEIAHEEIIESLNLKHTFFNPEVAMQTGVAACETGNVYEQEMSGETGQAFGGWRQGVIWGQVHDGNAHFLGGAAGHAGLFSTAQETSRIAEQFVAGQSEMFRPETCELFKKNMTTGLDEARTIAWKLAMTTASEVGPGLPLNSYGHSGFTGTSCWIDPNHERIFILLTNRTHAHPLPFININNVRREFHHLAVSALESLSSSC